ncbi:MAG: LytR C-terminal domain-containing protein [Actinomycetota bacterium]
MGAHEPPTNRSFYFSLATSTLRFAIIVALVVGGALLINQAFQGESPSQPDGGLVPTTSSTPSATPSPSGQPSPQIAGVRIAVFNGTQVTGLASGTADALERLYNYQIAQTPADAPSPVAQTTVYFRAPEDKVEAQALVNNFFKDLEDVKIAKLPASATNVEAEVQVAIYLGNDYAASQQ